MHLQLHEGYPAILAASNFSETTVARQQYILPLSDNLDVIYGDVDLISRGGHHRHCVPMLTVVPNWQSSLLMAVHHHLRFNVATFAVDCPTRAAKWSAHAASAVRFCSR